MRGQLRDGAARQRAREVDVGLVVGWGRWGVAGFKTSRAGHATARPRKTRRFPRETRLDCLPKPDAVALNATAERVGLLATPVGEALSERICGCLHLHGL